MTKEVRGIKGRPGGGEREGEGSWAASRERAENVRLE